jgi:hypothetical protein
MAILHLPSANRQLQAYETRDAGNFSRASGPFCRMAYAAAHVVADPLAANDPWLTPAIDWDRTIAYREYLWSMGLGVAEAMDTAQRGMGLEWDSARELIRRSVSAARAYGDATIANGCGTDHLLPNPSNTLDDIQSAYELQAEFIQAQGGRLILMASRALAASACFPDDYYRLYERLLAQVDEPVIIHWLGPMFDPALSGYWGHDDLDAAMDVCLDVIRSHPSKVLGVKVSLLDKHREIVMRRKLPPGVAMLSGDDFNYPELIEGDEQGYSDALLGIFDAIAPAASAALAALTAGHIDTYRKILAPTVALSRHIFQAPTRFYKTGVVLMAYLNGLQDHFVMVGGQQSARSIIHLSELFRLADRACLFHDPEDASRRMAHVLQLYGVSQP